MRALENNESPFKPSVPLKKSIKMWWKQKESSLIEHLQILNKDQEKKEPKSQI